MPKCNQCNNNAMYQLEGGVLLCLDCYEKLSRIQHSNIALLMAHQNQIMDHVDEITGFPSNSRYKIPQPIIYKDNKMQNFIKVDKSVIGAINTGTIASLNQSMNNINNNGDPELAKLFTIFTNAIIESKEIEQNIKSELLENLEFIAEQTTMPEQQKKNTISKKAIFSIKELINSSASLITIWQKIEPYINKIFM